MDPVRLARLGLSVAQCRSTTLPAKLIRIFPSRCSVPYYRVRSHLRCYNDRQDQDSSKDDVSTGTKVPLDSMGASKPPESRIQRTVAGLDALLGIQDEPQKPARGGDLAKDFKAQVSGKLNKTDSKAEEASKEEGAQVTISPEALDKMVDILSQKNKERSDAIRKDLKDQVQKVADKARKIESTMAKTDESTSSTSMRSSSSSSTSGLNEKMSDREREELLKEFEALVAIVDKESDEMLSRSDVKKLKDAAFGPQTFWVTETLPIVDPQRVGLLIRGNLRADREKVLEHVSQKVEELFPGKYETLMVFDKSVEQFEYDGTAAQSSRPGEKRGNVDRGPPVAFEIVPVSQARPRPTDGLQQATALALSLLFVGTCVQIGLATNISKLPPETLTWLAEPANLDSDQLPPGLEAWNPSSYFESAAPIITGLIGTNVVHELGHRVAAAMKGIRLGPSYFVPSFQSGCFGAITPFTSLLKDRAAMWDVSAAGPLAGFLASFALLVVGLFSSDLTQVSEDMLVPVPIPLLEGSLLLGTITKGVLGADATTGTQVLVSPLAIAGWYGMVTTALNLLPAGCLDGGRMVQGAFGKNVLSVTSFVTYLGLGLGLIGGSLSLPFGLYVILCQRTPERYIKDNVAPAGERRQTATMVALLIATLVLVPNIPDVIDTTTFGPDPADLL